ncbi:MAG: hypothetical protein ABH870_00455 [bacterium]
MQVAEKIKKMIQDLILPELETIKGENAEIKTILGVTNKRIDDINTHLIDQSRRIDETNKRIDDSRVELRKEISDLRIELKDEIFKNTLRIDETNKLIDDTNKRMDRLYEVIVRRDEHEKLEMKIFTLDHDVALMKTEIQERIAA